MSALDHFRLLRADARTEIHDLTLDSRTAGEGSLFLALHGAREDGADYAKEAAARGAVCVVTEHAAEGVPCVLVPDAHEAAAKLAARWYGEPAGRMTVVGVTGTNGKTTTTYLLKQLLERCLGAKVGLIGTNQNMIGDAVLPAERTTPDALTLSASAARNGGRGLHPCGDGGLLPRARAKACRRDRLRARRVHQSHAGPS